MFLPTHPSTRSRSSLAGCASLFRRFTRDEDGVLFSLGVPLLLPALVAAGVASELLGADADRTRLQTTLDRAVVAAVDLRHAGDPRQIVTQVFTDAGLAQHLSGIHVVEEGFHRQVTVEVTASFQSRLMRMAGGKGISATASSIALDRVPPPGRAMVLRLPNEAPGTLPSERARPASLAVAPSPGGRHRISSFSLTNRRTTHPETF